MDSGFSSPRTDAFPAGLRVLVVDDDLAWLRILEKMLKKCSYEVTTCCLARKALDFLRERKDGFDIVISDVNMPDMDGFKLLEHVGLEMDLPVIMMSVDGETSRVMRGVQHGACDYLLKPIRMKELRNIWQHVLRKRIHEVRDIESHEGFDEIQMARLDQFDDGIFLSAGEAVTGKKRKDADNGGEFSDSSSVKKSRVVWTVDLHQKFVTAVNQIGFEKVGPKKILDLMNVPWLTRENVASHLQKYRLYLGRLQKDNVKKASFGAIKQTDHSAKDPVINSPCNAINLKQNNSPRGICSIPSNKPLVQNVEPKFLDGDLKNIVSLPIQEPKRAPIHETIDPPKASSSRIGPTHSFRPLEPIVKYTRSDSNVPETYFWNEVLKTQFKKENGFNQISQPGPAHHFQINSVPFAAKPLESKRTETIEIKPSYTNYSSQQIRESVSKSLFPVPVSVTIPSSSQNLKNEIFIDDSKSGQENLFSETSRFASNGDLFSCLFQGDGNYKSNIEIQNRDYLSPNFPELFVETTAYTFDPQRWLDYEYQWESLEYPVIDQGLFIA